MTSCDVVEFDRRDGLEVRLEGFVVLEVRDRVRRFGICAMSIGECLMSDSQSSDLHDSGCTVFWFCVGEDEGWSGRCEVLAKMFICFHAMCNCFDKCQGFGKMQILYVTCYHCW